VSRHASLTIRNLRRVITTLSGLRFGQERPLVEEEVRVILREYLEGTPVTLPPPAGRPSPGPPLPPNASSRSLPRERRGTLHLRGISAYKGVDLSRAERIGISMSAAC